MEETFKFELVSPERVLMSVDAQEVVVPGSEGEFTVLPGHAPVITTLRPGVLHAVLPDGKKGIYVESGFSEVTPDSLIVLVEKAFIVDEADPRQIESELEAAKTSLDSAQDDEARRHITRAIDELRALSDK